MGKNAIVGQSGGPTSVINASLAGVFESCKNRGADTCTVCATVLPVCWRSGWWIFPPC